MIGKIKYILLVFGLILVSSCANMVTPTGGPKDTTPPKVLKAEPENHCTNFTGNKIEITFDEYVTLENASQNVLFSPPLGEKPDVKLNNKTVVIKFKQALLPNTTYTINFGSAVKDFHEGNIFKDYVYSFSTGENIDTLSIAGKIVDAESKKAVGDLFVGLYDYNHDSLFERPTKYPPDFITKTDKEGRFSLNGLPDKQFLVFALNDMNSNLFYDLPNETVAFLDTLVPASYRQPIRPDTLQPVFDTLTSRTFNQKALDLNLFAFTEKDTTQMLLEKKLVEEGLLRFVFRQPAQEVSITFPEVANDAFKTAEVWSPSHDILFYYFTHNVIDSLRVYIQYDTLINDSTRYSLRYRETRPKTRNKPNRLNVSNNLKNNLLMPDEPFVLTFSEPVNNVVEYNTMHFEKEDEYGLKYRLVSPMADSVGNAVNIPDSVFYSVRGRTNDSLHFNFKKATEKDIGNIYITVVPPENTQLVIQLLNSRNRVVDTCIIDQERRVAFKGLVAEKYKINAIIDKDRSGNWSTGNFHQRFLPETVVDYKDELDLKAGWDIYLKEKWILFSK